MQQARAHRYAIATALAVRRTVKVAGPSGTDRGAGVLMEMGECATGLPVPRHSNYLLELWFATNYARSMRSDRELKL